MAEALSPASGTKRGADEFARERKLTCDAEVVAKSGEVLALSSMPDGATSCAYTAPTLPSPKIAPIKNRFIFLVPSEGRPHAWNDPTHTVNKRVAVCLRSFAKVRHI